MNQYGFLSVRGLQAHIERAQRTMPNLAPWSRAELALCISAMRDEIERRGKI